MFMWVDYHDKRMIPKTLFSASMACELSCLFTVAVLPMSRNQLQTLSRQVRLSTCSDHIRDFSCRFTHSCHAWHTPGLKYLTKRRIHRHDLLSLLITSPTVQFTSHHMGNYIFLAETPFPQLLVDLLNFCSTSRISFSRIVSKCSVFSILSILKCSVVSGGEIDRFPSNHIINIFHQLNLDRIMLAFEMPACLSPSTHKSRGIQRCISHYEKALKLQNHSRIFVIWDPVVEQGSVALLDMQGKQLDPIPLLLPLNLLLLVPFGHLLEKVKTKVLER